MSDKFDVALKSLEHEIKSGMNESKEAQTRLNNAIDEIKAQVLEVEKVANRPSLTGLSTEDAEAKSAFEGFLRTGKLESKTMNATLTGTDGGQTVPKVIYNQIQKLLVDISPMRRLARVISASTADFRMPVSTGGTTSSWVGDTSTRPATNTSSIVTVNVPMGELNLLPVVSKQLQEDSQFDIVSYVAGEVATEVARAEGAAFVTGSGTNQPSGFLSAPTAVTADATRAFGTVQKVSTATAATIAADDLIALVYQLKAQHRSADCAFVLNKATLGAIRTLKDTTNNYLWTVGLGGQPDTLLGYPVAESEDMPGVATGNMAVAFGNWQSAYTIVDRVGVELLVNPYITPGFITYQTRMRVGGALMDSQALKLLAIK